MSNDQDQGGTRTRLAIIANSMTPYRTHLHNCIVREMPEVELHTLLTHARGDFQWDNRQDWDFEAVDFSEPGDTANLSWLKSVRRMAMEKRKASRIVDYLRRHRIQAIICSSPSYVSYTLLFRACHRLGIKVFVRSDANIENERGYSPTKKAIKARWYAYWMRWVDGVMPMGDLGERFFAQYWPHTDRVYRVPYWPDLSAYSHSDPGETDRFRQRFGLSADRKRILFCGRFIPVKRVDLLVDAFARLASKRPEWDLVIMGAGRLEDELRGRVPPDLEPRITWTGFLESRDLVAGYHACHVLAVPSSLEPWGLVVPEALSAGLPVVASDVVGAAHEMVHSGRSGEIFRSEDLAECEAALLKVTDSDRFPVYQSYACESVNHWAEQSNPLEGIRIALRDTLGVAHTPAAAAR